MTSVTRWVLLLCVLLAGMARFVWSGLRPATRSLAGDFAAVFPTSYFAQLRPDFPTEQVWAGWYYGPMLHFLTLPLLMVPEWSMVPLAWALVNCAAIAVCFALVRYLPSVRTHPLGVAWLAALWLLYQPLVNCLSQGNIEIVEMAMILAAIVALSRGRASIAGVLMGIAAMTKFLPFGFLGWFLLKRCWRAFAAGIATVAVIAVATAFTLGWNNAISLENMEWSVGNPLAGVQELSVTSLFMHRSSVLLRHGADSHPIPAWFPAERADVAFRVGLGVSLLLGLGLAVALYLRRRRPASSPEVAVLFMTMFMILPWNHDYYYVFALVPISILFFDSLERRARGQLTATLVGYFLISPPVPFSWVDQSGILQTNFADVYNYLSLPILGALILWIAAVARMFSDEAHESYESVETKATRRVAPLAAAGATVATVIALIVTGVLWTRDTAKSAAESTLVRLEPAMDVTGANALAFSPDGDYVAYVTNRNNVRSLCVHSVRLGQTTCPPPAVDAAGPFFSPDSRWVGFFTGRHLKKISVDGQRLQLIAEIDGARSAEWGNDGTILVATAASGIWRVHPTSPSIEIVVPAVQSDGAYSWPTMLPSGEIVLFAVGQPGGFGAEWIWAYSTSTGRRKTIVEGSQPHFNRSTGHLIYTSAGRVLAVPFDPATLSTSGPAFPLAPGVLVTPDAGPFVAHDGDGTLVMLPASATPPLRRELVWVDRAGAVEPLPVPADAFQTPRLSPDRRRLVVGVRGVFSDLWSYDVETFSPARVSFTAGSNESPVWTPTGQIAFSVPLQSGFGRGVGAAILLTPPGGTEFHATRLWDGRGPVRLGSWSAPDGRIVGTQDGDLWLFDPKGVPAQDADTGATEAPVSGRNQWRTLIARTEPTEMTPAFSPDGRYFAYASNQSGQFEIYVRALLGSRDRYQVSTGGGTEPTWAANGRELFYRRGDAMFAVPVDTRASFTVGLARLLFHGDFFAEEGKTSYDVGPDGRFLMLQPVPVGAADSTALTLIRNAVRSPPR